MTCALGLAAAAAWASNKDKGFGELSVAEVAKRRTEPGFYIYDNNYKEAFAKGHVPGAKWLDPREMTAKDLPADKEATLVFYCANVH